MGPASNYSVYKDERFRADETFSRLIDANAERACEAARRALLSQGYVMTAAQPTAITGNKEFQPEPDVHVEIIFDVVCVPDDSHKQVSTTYISARQVRYAVKRSPNASSLGVAGIGSISLPISSSQESLVKIASETIPAGEFYDRFFALMEKMLGESAGEK